jgi:8-oxo-dGTP pyrophosphatase MutT (NUDIX family)
MLRFHAPGDWPPGHVTTTWVADGRRRVGAVEATIDAAWAAASARPGVRLFDGPMCRLESWHATPVELRLTLSPTSYRPFLGTNMANPQLADEHGRGVMANPVGVSPALLTADGFLMLGRRNGSVAYYPGRVHPFAGSLEPTDADVFAAVRRELAEELSLGDADLADLRCTGVAEDVSLRQPELIFAAATRLTRLQVEARVDPDEHAGIWAVPATQGDIVTAIDAGRHLLTPVAVASLLLWGRIRFGDDWFAHAGRPVVSA